MDPITKPKILNVNDDEASLYTWSRVLRAAGFEVIEARNGNQALKRAQENPQLILLDVQLPDMSGFDVCNKIKTDPATASISILHISAQFKDSQHKIMGLDIGADGYLTVPIESQVLVSYVKALLRAREAELALKKHTENLEVMIENRTRQLKIKNQENLQLLEELNKWNNVLEERVEKRSQALIEAHNETRQAMKEVKEEIKRRGLTELSLKKQTIALEASNESLQNFAYIVSHDLKEPLRNISNFTNLLNEEYSREFDDVAQSYMAFILNGVSQMKGLINAVLDLSRVETHAQDFAAVDCNQIVDDVLQTLRVKIAQEDAEVVVSGMPLVFGDVTQLELVFLNLISNALIYRREDNPKVEISAVQKGQYWQFCIADNGIGISEENYDRIFRIFKRLHTREEFEGTGIGLALVKKIVERHSGEIWLESELGMGTTFYFTLPNVD